MFPGTASGKYVIASCLDVLVLSGSRSQMDCNICTSGKCGSLHFPPHGIPRVGLKRMQINLVAICPNQRCDHRRTD
ncbi:hypothetical protein BDV41DRAFT_540098 [Aspergillus transmontanensis]|uniref:Uncharacterized protein n=1 Tax=Aspergillus transmontanensis TaxID=1034304 RepID=A0A5N6VU31_9EURO|nr:hypothetical protein BDV41DRAFT_540098 [Aspergillus transmontanensis]